LRCGGIALSFYHPSYSLSCIIVGNNAFRKKDMEPTIIQKDHIFLLGFSFFGDPFETSAGWTEENEIGRLWNRFIAYFSEHGEQINHLKSADRMYEVHIYHKETEEMGHFEVFVGVEVERYEDPPVTLLAKILPATQYAMFTLEGEQITSDWPWELSADWLPQRGLQMSHPFDFQLYDERFKGLDPIDESILEVYVPVKPLDRSSEA
jgi:AraC family transcriptional regulator